MKRFILLAALPILAFAVSCAKNNPSAPSTIPAADTETPVPALTATSTASVTRTFTAADTVTDTATATQTYTVTGTVTGTETATETRTVTETGTCTYTETQTHTGTFTCTATNTHSYTATHTSTDTLTHTATLTSTYTATDTCTSSPTFTHTETATHTFTTTQTHTATSTATATATPHTAVINDPSGDYRTDFGAASVSADMTGITLTYDASNLYILINVSSIYIPSGNQAPQVQIAIDRDQAASSGNADFAGFAETGVSPQAYWERLIVTRFGSNSAAPAVWDQAWSVQYAGTESINAGAGTMTLVIPWSALGGYKTGTLRFTVAAFLSDAADSTLDISGTSDALDAITDVPGNTWAEVSDGIVNYYFDIVYP